MKMSIINFFHKPSIIVTTILISLIVILAYILILNRERLRKNIEEKFQDNSIQISNSTKSNYNTFIKTYDVFCKNWKKAIESSVASEIPQQPLTDPSQVKSITGAPTISDEKMNEYIKTLSNKLSQPLPEICLTLPDTINNDNIEETINDIPTDIQSYTNALDWMNTKLSQSHDNLNSALSGNYTHINEAFIDACQNISECIKNNPNILNELEEQQKKKKKDSIEELEKALNDKINAFLVGTEDKLQTNKELFERSTEIQQQAQSGELIKQINVPGGNTIARYTIPDGGNRLNEMKESDPNKYNELKQNYKNWFSLKELIEQINSNL